MNHSNLIPLQEVYDYLASGELSNLFMADGGLGTGVLKDKYKAVVNKSIYLGLTDLHSRFVLKKDNAYRKIEKDFHGVAVEVVNLLVSRDGLEINLIADNFVEVLEVYINDREYIINDSDGYVLLATNRIKFSSPIANTDTIKIEYQANHNPITEDTTHIELPRMYLNALCYFIASRLYTSIVNQLDGDLNESNRYAQKYHQEIMMLESKGYDVDNFNQMCLFHAKGFI